MAHPTRIAPLAAFLLAAAPPAFGANPIQGGPGGGPFRLQCGNGQYVTGVEVHSGTLIDSIAAYCSFYDAGKRMFSAGVPRLTKPAGGPGGSGRAARCADNQALVQIKYGFTRNGNKPRYLDYVEIVCRPLASTGNGSETCLDSGGNGCWDKHPNPGPYNGFGLSFRSTCGGGTWPNALTGRSGKFVDALALDCAPHPNVP